MADLLLMPPLFVREDPEAPGLMRQPKVAFRASMLPVGNYEDGSIAFPVWPQTAVDAYEALDRFGRGENPQPQDAVLAGLAMAGSGIGHLGLRAAGRAVSGTAPESVAASRTLPSHSVEAGSPIIDPQIAAGDAAAAAVPDTRSWWQKATGSGEAELGIARLEARKAAMRADAIEGLRDVPPSGPIRAKVYRGASRDEQWPPSSYEGKAFWASDNMDAASAYAGTPGDNAVTNWLIDTQGFDQARIPKGHITPAEIAFQKPLVLDAKGGQWGNIKVGNRNYYTDQLADLAREFGHDGLVVRNVVDDAPAGTTYAALQPGTVRSATTGDTLFANAKEGAPVGMLASSGLDRMRVEDAARPRSIPDAPQSMTELETLLGNSYDRYGQDRAPAARAEDPQRYWDYANGLHDVLNPESEWFNGSPTLQSGGAPAGLFGAVGGPAPGLMREPEGQPAPGLMAQQSPRDKLQERGYLGRVPTPSVMQEALGQDQINAYEAFMRPRINTLLAIGIPPQEARALIEQMPDVLSYRKRLSDEGMADPRLQDELRKLLEDVR